MPPMTNGSNKPMSNRVKAKKGEIWIQQCTGDVENSYKTMKHCI